MSPTLNLIIKVTRRCNLRCVYCHEWRDNSAPVMSLDTVEALCEAALSSSGRRVVQFVWHGGEPTLAPISFYRHALELQQRLRGSVVVKNTIQTNAFSLTDQWLDFIVDNGISLGVSIDGPPELHDRLRLTIAGRPTYAQVTRTLERVRQRGIDFGVLSVLSPELIRLGAGRTHEFLTSLGASVVDLIPEDPENVAGGTRDAGQPFVTRTAWSAFMCELFDLWWHAPTTYRVLTFESVLRKLLGASARTCLISGGCFGSAFGVETDGRLFHCGLFEGVADYEFGNVHSTTFDEILTSDGFVRVAELNARRTEELTSCPAYGVCSGGCPHDAFIYQLHDQNGVERCCGWRELIEHIGRVAGPRLAEQAKNSGIHLTLEVTKR
jgi:uncharacterized protein